MLWVLTRTEEILIEYIKKNQKKLYKVAYSYANDEEAALDIMQEAITKSLENISQIKNENYITTWFYRILINEGLQYIRKNKRIIECPLTENERDFSLDVENRIEYLDAYSVIQNLKPKVRTIIILRYFENMKIDEIAKILKVNTNTVKSRLYKGLQELKECFERREKNE